MQLYIALYREGLSVGPLHRKGVSTPSPIPLLCASFALRARDGSHPDVCMSPRLSLAFWVVILMMICVTLLNARLFGLVCTLVSTTTPVLHRQFQNALVHTMCTLQAYRDFTLPTRHSMPAENCIPICSRMQSPLGILSMCMYDELLRLTRASKADISCAFELECTRRYSLAGKRNTCIYHICTVISIYIYIYIQYYI